MSLSLLAGRTVPVFTISEEGSVRLHLCNNHVGIWESISTSLNRSLVNKLLSYHNDIFDTFCRSLEVIFVNIVSIWPEIV